MTVTVPDQTRLSVGQHLAIDALLTGSTHRAAAADAGVQRTTVTGWVNHHVAFIAEMKARRAARSGAIADGFDDVITKALDVVAAKLDDGDLGAALAVLKMAGPDRFARPVAGPESVDSGENIGDILRAKVRRIEEAESRVSGGLAR